MAGTHYEVSGVVIEKPSPLAKVFNIRTILKFISIASLFIIWTLLVKFNVYRFGLLPNPTDVLTWGIEWGQGKVFWIDVAYTFARVWGGVLTACVIAIPMGLMIGWNKVFSDFTFKQRALFKLLFQCLG